MVKENLTFSLRIVFQRTGKFHPNFLMPQQEDKAPPNKGEPKEKVVESLLNYECEDDDDGTDWET